MNQIFFQPLLTYMMDCSEYLPQLEQMFPDLDGDIILDVLEGQGGDVDKAILSLSLLQAELHEEMPVEEVVQDPV